MDTWAVLLTTGNRPDDTYVYGPFADEEQATRFARTLSQEVDPARPYRLHSPVTELLNLAFNLREYIK